MALTQEGRRDTSIVDLPDSAADTLVDLLLQQGSLQAARLVSRGWLSVVDTYTSKLHIKLSAEDRELWTAGRLSRLERWQGCRSVKLRLCPGQAHATQAVNAAALLTLPFAHGSRECRQRFTQVEVSHSDAFAAMPGCSFDVAIPGLAHLLPNLKSLLLAEATCMSHDMYTQQLMYVALASLPHLEELELPSCRALERIGAMAGCTSLRRLAVRAGDRPQDAVVSPQAAAGIAQLSGLTSLEFHDCAFPRVPGGPQPAGSGGLPALLDGLPASLQRLHISRVGRDRSRLHVELSLRQHDGSGGPRIHDVRVGVHADGLRGLVLCSFHAAIARLLLACRAMGPRLGTVGLQGGLVVATGDLERQELAPMWALLRRAARVEVGAFVVYQLAQVPPLLDLVHGLRELVLVRPHGTEMVMRLWLCSPAISRAPSPPAGGGGDRASSAAEFRSGAAVADGGGGDGGGGLATPPLPSAADLARAVLRRMAPRPEPAPTPLAASGSAGVVFQNVGAGAAQPAPALNGAQAGSPSLPGKLLLLEGPLVAGLAHTPELFKGWISWLGSAAATATAAAAAAPGVDVGGAAAAAAAASQCFVSYQVLPAAGAVILEAREGAAEAALQAAVAAVNGRQGAASAVTISRVKLKGETQGLHVGRGSKPRLAQRAYLGATIHEVQELWDGRVGACGGSWEAERALLRRLLGLWESLLELPPETRL